MLGNNCLENVAYQLHRQTADIPRWRVCRFCLILFGTSIKLNKNVKRQWQDKLRWHAHTNIQTSDRHCSGFVQTEGLLSFRKSSVLVAGVNVAASSSVCMEYMENLWVEMGGRCSAENTWSGAKWWIPVSSRTVYGTCPVRTALAASLGTTACNPCLMMRRIPCFCERSMKSSIAKLLSFWRRDMGISEEFCRSGASSGNINNDPLSLTSSLINGSDLASSGSLCSFLKAKAKSGRCLLYTSRCV